jgi:hypothetical protein
MSTAEAYLSIVVWMALSGLLLIWVVSVLSTIGYWLCGWELFFRTPHGFGSYYQLSFLFPVSRLPSSHQNPFSVHLLYNYFFTREKFFLFLVFSSRYYIHIKMKNFKFKFLKRQSRARVTKLKILIQAIDFDLKVNKRLFTLTYKYLFLNRYIGKQEKRENQFSLLQKWMITMWNSLIYKSCEVTW